MYDIRKDKDTKLQNNNYKLFNSLKKLKWKYILYSIIMIIILFPKLSGSLIGYWIINFFGTIINIING